MAMNIKNLNQKSSVNKMLSCGLGYGRASSQRLMTPWALVRIGSVSKVVTAVGILRLYNDRQVNLHSTVFGETGRICLYSIIMFFN